MSCCLFFLGVCTNSINDFLKLLHYITPIPVAFEGEGSIHSTSFTLGGKAGAFDIVDIEATPLGVIVRRDPNQPGSYDVLVQPSGAYGRLAVRTRAEPAQLVQARKDGAK